MSKNISKVVVDKIINTVSNKLGSKLNQMTDKKKKNGKKGKKQKVSRQNLSIPGNQLFSRHENPLTSFQIPSNSFAASSAYQKNVTCDNKGGIRVSGRSLSKIVIAGSASDDVRILLDDGLYYTLLPIVPSVLDIRVSNFAMIYNMYAIRSLKVTYVPSCGTGSSSQIALGLTDDFAAYNATFSGGVTQQMVLELPYSGLTTMWAPMALTYSFTGTETFNTRSNSINEQDDRIQVGIVGAANVSANQSYGALVVEWVIDFYEPTTYNNNVEFTDRNVLPTGTRAKLAAASKDKDDGPDEPILPNPGTLSSKPKLTIHRSPSQH